MFYLAYVPGPVTSYVAGNPADLQDPRYPANPARGVEYTALRSNALRFSSQAAISDYLSRRPTAVIVQGGTGSPALTVEA